MMTADSAEIAEGSAKRATVLKHRFLVCLPLGLVVMALSMIPAWQFPGWQWVVAVAALPVVTWGAWPFHQAAFQAGRHGSTTMDTLVSLGVSVASLWSYGALVFGGAGEIGMTMSMSLIPRSMHGSHTHLYFEAATMIVVFLLGGRWAEARSRYRAGDALREILTLGAKEATILKYPHSDGGDGSIGSDARAGGSGGMGKSYDGESGEPREITIPTSELQVGDLMVVRAGEKIPTDGIIVKGTSAVDNSMLTGEAIPEDVAPKDVVIGGAINTWGLLHVKATRVGQETTLAQIGRMVVQAQATKAPIQRLADRVSSVFVPIIIVLAIITFGVWLALGFAWTTALTCAVAVLVVACPCALGLATPTALLVGSGRAAQLGIVIRNAEVLENTRRIDTVVLDKTGTVTTGKIQVDKILPIQGKQFEPELLSLSAAVESGSKHPLAAAIRQRAQMEELEILPSTAFTNHPGGGVSAIVQDRILWLGSLRWVTSQGVQVPKSLRQEIEQAEASGATVSVLVDAGRARTEPSVGESVDGLFSENRENREAISELSEPSVDLTNQLSADQLSVGGSPVNQPVLNEKVSEGAFTDADGIAGVTNSIATDATATYSTNPATGADNAESVNKIRVEMRVEGMTCAACVRRVEKKLSKLNGVTSTVNLATEIATIELDSEWADAALEKVVNDAGYRGHVISRELVSDLGHSGELAGKSSEFQTRTQSQIQTQLREQTTVSSSSPANLANPANSGERAKVLGAIVLRDQVKADAAQAISELKRLRIEPVLLTGDNQAAANQVAQQIGITEVVAQVQPDQKRQKIVELQQSGHQVAMVGDGINDAAALAQASNQGLSIAMGQGTDLAIAVADITLMQETLNSVPQAIRLSRRTLNTIKGNLFWAFFYNVAMVPLAAFGLLNPMLASAAMACSSVFVVLNSLRLKTQK